MLTDDARPGSYLELTGTGARPSGSRPSSSCARGSPSRSATASFPGHRLPPVRRLAADLGLAPNTVARAYRELEQAGVVEGKGTRGTFVVGPPTGGDDLRAAAADYVRRATEMGASPQNALEVVRAALSLPGAS